MYSSLRSLSACRGLLGTEYIRLLCVFVCQSFSCLLCGDEEEDEADEEEEKRSYIENTTEGKPE